jgi:protein-S-isoprenylcysteine O-methyltransferase Ste14
MLIWPELAVALLWLLWVLSWIAAAAFTNRTKVAMRAWPLAHARALAGLGGFLLFLPHHSPRWPAAAWFVSRLWPGMSVVDWVLVALTAAGFALCWWARVRLGRLWSSTVTLKEGHRLVVDGPYALVRHPIYAGLVFATAMTAVTRASPSALIGAGLIAVTFTFNARLEEGFLREQLGAAEYDAYASRVGMLVPKLGR